MTDGKIAVVKKTKTRPIGYEAELYVGFVLCAYGPYEVLKAKAGHINGALAPIIQKAREDALEEAAKYIQERAPLTYTARELADGIRALSAPGKGERRAEK